MATDRCILVTGATGRLGRVLRAVWPGVLPAGARPLWQGRGAVLPGWVAWDMLAEPYGGPRLEGGVILHLAGVTTGDDRGLAANAALALAACEAAVRSGARHVLLASSAAVYGPGAGDDLTEETPPAPATAYGRAKLEMERQVIAWHAAQGSAAPGITLVRIGNVAGSDSLIGGARAGRPVILDPVPGREGGPERSYIGPHSLAVVLAGLATLALEGRQLPQVLNLCADPAVRMADLLCAAGIDWHYGPRNPAVIPRVVLSTARLRGLIDLPPEAGRADRMTDEWRALGGGAE